MTAPGDRRDGGDREDAGDVDALWDGRGAPDPDVARLARALAPLAHRPPPGGLDVAALPAQDPAPAGRRRWPAVIAGVAVAAAVAAGAAIWLATRPASPGAPPLACGAPGPRGAMAFAATAGQPRCGGDVVTAGWLPVGAALETGEGDGVRVEVADIGQIQLAPGSRLALVATGAREHRLALDRGKLHARVTAPPRLFVIDTPAATAIDLGCEYDLEVAADGSSWLRVTSGKVELAGAGRTVLVPMGAETSSRQGQPPATPWAIDASPAMRAAVARVDRALAAADAAAVAPALAAVIDLAGARDTVTLWNLLGAPGLDGAARGRLFDRITVFVPAPDWVMRDDVVAGDAQTLDELRRTLEDVWFHPESLD